MAQWILGLTGGIGAGKTAVSNALADKGICIVDADVIAREVVAPNSDGLQAIIDKFGRDMLQSDGMLNRAALRELIFSNEAHKSWLNNLLHPMIRETILSQLSSANSSYVVLSAPLLFENQLDALCNHTLLVDVSEEIQIHRTTQRDKVSSAHIKQIITAQMPRQEKCNKADSILDNSGSLTQMHSKLEVLHQGFLKQAQSL
ncbi:dephospho-CoA kinase [Pseudoalteromonas citrea]|uniref:Dephospho-CoA kinase n=2 Tax=Pseudoalteromonas citrea TaxID=43655 RepID=A0AAD4AJ31_9GAMM|nr:dephospho-CoA kinase [Pseudoalteromonas citrea]KAF7772032.1 dephospho-CoA kinase [Pseudoalteromonas citrea]